jgi:CRP/FNR family transcriptional regulator, cyclic AMP receptor protein
MSKNNATMRGAQLFRRRPDEKTKLLQSVPLFGELSRTQITQVEQLVTEIKAPAGQRLATAGEYGKELVIIVEGRATVIVGRKRTVRLGPGDFWGEMSLVDGGPRSATVEAASDMRLLVVGGREFSQLLQRAPLIAIKIMRVMSQRLRDVETSVSA